MSHRDPVLVASYPKSGRTWLTVLLGKAIADTCGLPDRDLFKLFKESGPPRKAAKCMPAMWFSHDGTQFDALMMPDDLKRDMSRYQSKVIVLVREPKDVLVSHYFQLTQRRFFEGETGASAKEKHSALKTMSRNDFCERAGIRLQDGEITMGAFLRSPMFGARKVLTHQRNWAKGIPTLQLGGLLVRYEDLHEHPERELQRIVEFAHIRGMTPDVMQRAIEFARFDSMRGLEETSFFKNERLEPGVKGKVETYKTRRGKCGGWRDELSPEDVAYVNQVSEELGHPFYAPTSPIGAAGR